MTTAALRRQVKNIVHNYSEAEIKVLPRELGATGLMLSCSDARCVQVGVRVSLWLLDRFARPPPTTRGARRPLLCRRLLT